MLPGDYIVINHTLATKPDIVKFYTTPLSQSLDPLTANNNFGDWYWDNDTYTVSYIIINKQSILADFAINLNIYKCRYAICVSPVNQGFKLPITKRPAIVLYWSNITTWSLIPTLNGTFLQSLPQSYESILIPDGRYVIVDCPLPKIQYLKIEGSLELDNSINHRLEANIIFINGGQLIIGWENNPILTNVEIVLWGEKSKSVFKLPEGFSMIGSKGMGVYGGLDIHGKPRNVSWTRLNQTALVGSNNITLIEPVDWQVGEEIIITTTSFIANQSEVMRITSLSSDRRTLTFNQSFQFKHLAFSEKLPSGATYRIAAGVGLLTRNVKIIGGEYAEQEIDLYGFRIIVSDYSAVVNGLPVFYQGYARIDNVELARPGQFSALSGDDIKFGILFSNLGPYNSSRPSYVRKSSFHHGYACAVAIFKSAAIPIEDNVIFRTIVNGMRIEGNSNIIRRNLVVMNFWTGSIIEELAKYDRTYLGTIDVFEAASVVLEDNFVAGSDRIGIYFRGDVCPGGTVDPGFNHSISGNTVYASLQGVVILPVNCLILKF